MESWKPTSSIIFISAVLARHLADNYVKHDASHLGTLEKNLKSLTTRLDNLDNPKDKQPGKQPKVPKDKDKSGSS
jgi:hypothetical protein